MAWDPDLGEEINLNIAVLSGKGGTGKTTISANLALALQGNYIDVDVEEPNGFLFLKPQIDHREEVLVNYPMIHKDQCKSCGRCVAICQFNALAQVGKEILVFEKLCHDCGACKIVCEDQALTYGQRSIGQIERGIGSSIHCSRGILEVGEPMAIPVIRQLLKNSGEGTNIMDCSPGTSCNVVQSLRYADRAILVTEPTAFGLHDLKRAVAILRMFSTPFGVIINKEKQEENQIRQYCQKENIIIIGSLPYRKEIATAYSKGEMLYHHPQYKQDFDQIAKRVREVFLWN